VDRRTLLAFILVGIIIIVMPYYLKLVSPPVESPPGAERVVDSLWVGEGGLPESVGGGAGVAEFASPLERGRAYYESADERWRALERAEPVIFTVETDLYVGEISSRAGGSVASWRLNEYSGPTGEPVQLIADASVPNLSVSIVAFPSDSVDFGDAIFASDTPDGSLISLSEGRPEFVARFAFDMAEGRRIEKVLTFRYDSYAIGLAVNLIGFAEELPHRSYGLSWRTPLAYTEANLADDMREAHAYALIGGELEKVDAEEKPEIKRLPGVTRWTAVRTKYFVAALIPQDGLGVGAQLVGRERRLPSGQALKEFAMTLDVPVEEGSQEGNRFIAYIGPLEYGLVKSYDVGLDQIMNFGWGVLRPIAKVVLLALTFMHRGIANYGVVIILFSVFIKALVYPLTHKSYVSMKRMQELQPQIAALREKYKGEQQTVNRKVMALYKQSGVNPLGGCLPILLQMPLLFSLFIVFRSTIELRGAPFFWWIGDLSAQDVVLTLPFSIPLYGANVCILPVLMGATTFLQQKMSSAQATQQQAMMLYIMPVFMTLIFNQFPSGLNLYYTVFNVLSMVQQKFLVNRKGTVPKTEKAPKSSGARKRKRRK